MLWLMFGVKQHVIKVCSSFNNYISKLPYEQELMSCEIS